MSTVANPNYKKGFVPFAIAALLVSLIGGFTAVLGPAFVADQGIDYNNTTWISLALAMSSAACAPILGKLGDVLGRRTTLLLGIVIFAAGNVLTAVATSLILDVYKRQLYDSAGLLSGYRVHQLGTAGSERGRLPKRRGYRLRG